MDAETSAVIAKLHAEHVVAFREWLAELCNQRHRTARYDRAQISSEVYDLIQDIAKLEQAQKLVGSLYSEAAKRDAFASVLADRIHFLRRNLAEELNQICWPCVE